MNDKKIKIGSIINILKELDQDYEIPSGTSLVNDKLSCTVTVTSSVVTVAIARTTTDTNSMYKNDIIEKINYSGKWVEIWLKGQSGKVDGSFDESSKIQYLWKAIEEAGLDGYVANNGLKGLHIQFIKNCVNWEIHKIGLDNKSFDRIT